MVIIPLNGSAPSFSIQNRQRGTRRSSWIAAFYGAGLTIFLLIALVQSTNAISDYPAEFVLCMLNGGLSIYGQLLSLRRGASIHFSSFFCSCLFRSAAPIVQLGANNDVVFGIDHLALWSAVNALAFTVIGVLFTHIGLRNLKTKRRVSSPSRTVGCQLLIGIRLTAFGIAIGAIIPV